MASRSGRPARREPDVPELRLGRLEELDAADLVPGRAHDGVRVSGGDAEDRDLSGLDVEEADVAEAVKVNPEEWRAELPLIEEWFEFVGEKLPTGVKDEFEALKQRLAD